jgi:hypothetical protein
VRRKAATVLIVSAVGVAVVAFSACSSDKRDVAAKRDCSKWAGLPGTLDAQRRREALSVLRQDEVTKKLLDGSSYRVSKVVPWFRVSNERVRGGLQGAVIYMDVRPPVSFKSAKLPTNVSPSGSIANPDPCLPDLRGTATWTRLT